MDAQVAGLDWYHTLELAPGVTTPGWFDTRTVPPLLPFPASLAGRRCLDVGTFDGFWAFEMERRGADEVIAIDILDPNAWDWPAGSDPAMIRDIGARNAGGRGFEIAREALGSRVRRLERSIYDLDPAIDGRFDFIYVGSLLLHLRDPVGALRRVAAVSAGDVLVVDAYDPWLTWLSPRRPAARLDAVGRPWWWKPNLAALPRMLSAAGLSLTGPVVRVSFPAGAGAPRARLRPRLLASPAGREALRLTRRGEPHAALPARPSR